MDQLLAAFAADDREEMARIWNEFDAGLNAHLEVEERYLIPALLRVSGRDARTIIQEHQHIRTRLGELGAALDLHIVRLDTARAFVDELRAHAAHEDAILYRWSDEHLDLEERNSLLAALLETAKHKLQERAERAP